MKRWPGLFWLLEGAFRTFGYALLFRAGYATAKHEPLFFVVLLVGTAHVFVVAAETASLGGTRRRNAKEPE